MTHPSIRDQWPEPPRNRMDRLRHFMDQWRDFPDDALVIFTTIGVYDQPTGVAMGDLRYLVDLADRLDRLSAETVSADSPAGRMLGRLERPVHETGSGLPKFHD